MDNPVIGLALTLLLPLSLTACGAYFNIYLRIFYLLHPVKTLKAAFGKNKLQSLRVFFLSLAGELGMGNIAGVAVAVSLGGAGAVFWMLLSALFSMILKYCEITLGMRYGGTLGYIRRVGGKAGSILSGAFALLALGSSLTIGNTIQANAAADALRLSCGIPVYVTGAVIAVFLGVILFGGSKRITTFTSFAVPLMSVIYIYLTLRTVLSDIPGACDAVRTILSGAFGLRQAGAGALGAAIRHGVSKGAFSHEAGAGTAPLAHSDIKGKEPAAQGIFGIFEVFFDTVVMCTLTAVVIIMSGESGSTGMETVIKAFSHFFGNNIRFLIAPMSFLFAFSSIVCWAYYGIKCLNSFTSKKKYAARSTSHTV